ncbi:hypothetical protein HY484_03340 [Candidatus Woesearchaeota archaeon]|nr:hypothetical protein [Candidatus Woesearchaeota archaeon]
MAAKIWAVLLVVFCTLLTSSAQILYKFGALRLPEIITNVPLLTGIVLYVFAAVILIVSFKGGDVTVLYPIIATSYIWVAVLSYFFLNESLSFLKFFGIFSIFTGICFIGFGSRNNADVPGVV